jgi:hypothetical protein
MMEMKFKRKNGLFFPFTFFGDIDYLMSWGLVIVVYTILY